MYQAVSFLMYIERITKPGDKADMQKHESVTNVSNMTTNDVKTVLNLAV